METKDRVFKNIFTTVIGAIMMILALVILVVNMKGLTFTTIGLVAALAVLGYTFLMAKDTLLEGLLMGFFKIQKQN